MYQSINGERESPRNHSIREHTASREKHLAMQGRATQARLCSLGDLGQSGAEESAVDALQELRERKAAVKLQCAMRCQLATRKVQKLGLELRAARQVREFLAGTVVDACPSRPNSAMLPTGLGRSCDDHFETLEDNQSSADRR